MEGLINGTKDVKSQVRLEDIILSGERGAKIDASLY